MVSILASGGAEWVTCSLSVDPCKKSFRSPSSRVDFLSRSRPKSLPMMRPRFVVDVRPSSSTARAGGSFSVISVGGGCYREAQAFMGFSGAPAAGSGSDVGVNPMLRRRRNGKTSMCPRLRCAWQPNNRLQSCQMGPVLSGSGISHVTRVIGTGNGWEWLGRGAEMRTRRLLLGVRGVAVWREQQGGERVHCPLGTSGAMDRQQTDEVPNRRRSAVDLAGFQSLIFTFTSRCRRGFLASGVLVFLPPLFFPAVFFFLLERGLSSDATDGNMDRFMFQGRGTTPPL